MSRLPHPDDSRQVSPLRQPTIRRAKHGKDNPYFMMLRDTAQDRNLSYEARGVLAYILSRPDDWHVQVADLIIQADGKKTTKAGKSKVYAILDELAEHGYIVKPKRFQDDKGKWIWTPYEVYERPYTDLPDMGEPETAEPSTGEPVILHSTEVVSSEGDKAPAPEPPNPTPAEVDTAIYGTSEETPITLDEAKRILDLPAHLRNTTLDNMASLPLIDAYAEGIGAPYIATRADKVNALRAIMAGYTPDDMRATVKAKRKPDKPYALSWAISDLASVKAAGTAKPRMVGHMLDDLDPEAPDYWERVAERLNSPKKVIA